MTNQSLLAIPPNLNDSVVLRRFLSQLVEQLDIILGNRANENEQYASKKELNTTEQLLHSAQQALIELNDQLHQFEDNTIVELSERLKALEDNSVVIESPYGVVTGIERLI